MLPSYSVLMSVYYKEKAEYLSESLASMLSQTHMPSEIVLVCDGKLTDSLEDMIETFNDMNPCLLKLVRIEKNVGLGQALNYGLKHCSNEYVARMDTDDISVSYRIEKQLSYMLENQLDICGSNVLEFNNYNDEKYIKEVPESHQKILQYAKTRSPFNHPSVIFKKSIILVAGGYEHMPFFEDYLLWVKVLMQNAKCGNVQEELVHMRSNDDFYARRGGKNYYKALSCFWKRVAAIGFVTKPQAYKNIVERGIVAVMPNSIRQKFYKKIFESLKVETL